MLYWERSKPWTGRAWLELVRLRLEDRSGPELAVGDRDIRRRRADPRRRRRQLALRQRDWGNSTASETRTGRAAALIGSPRRTWPASPRTRGLGSAGHSMLSSFYQRHSPADYSRGSQPRCSTCSLLISRIFLASCVTHNGPIAPTSASLHGVCPLPCPDVRDAAILRRLFAILTLHHTSTPSPCYFRCLLSLAFVLLPQRNPHFVPTVLRLCVTTVILNLSLVLLFALLGNNRSDSCAIRSYMLYLQYNLHVSPVYCRDSQGSIVKLLRLYTRSNSKVPRSTYLRTCSILFHPSQLASDD